MDMYWTGPTLIRHLDYLPASMLYVKYYKKLSYRLETGRQQRISL